MACWKKLYKWDKCAWSLNGKQLLCVWEAWLDAAHSNRWLCTSSSSLWSLLVFVRHTCGGFVTDSAPLSWSIMSQLSVLQFGCCVGITGFFVWFYISADMKWCEVSERWEGESEWQARNREEWEVRGGKREVSERWEEEWEVRGEGEWEMRGYWKLLGMLSWQCFRQSSTPSRVWEVIGRVWVKVDREMVCACDIYGGGGGYICYSYIMAARAISNLTTRAQSARVRLIGYHPSAPYYNWLFCFWRKMLEQMSEVAII